MKQYKAWELLPEEKVYLKSESDLVIAEKDKEIAALKAMAEEREKEIEFMRSNCKWYAGDRCDRLHGELMAAVGDVGELKAEIESLKASHYADGVDAGMRERRLKRALYKACANWAKCEEQINNRDAYDASEYLPSAEDKFRKKVERWSEMATKCLKKAEEYK